MSDRVNRRRLLKGAALGGAGMIAPGVRTLQGSAKALGQARVLPKATVPAVEYLPLPPMIQALWDEPLAPLPLPVQRALANAAFDSEGGLPVDFPGTLLEDADGVRRPVAEQAVELTQGRLERIAARSLLTHANGGEPAYPTMSVLSPSVGGGIGVFVVSPQYERDGDHTSIDHYLKGTLAPVGTARLINTRQFPIEQAVLARADPSTDPVAANDPHAVTYRLEASLARGGGVIDPIYVAASNVDKLSGGAIIGRGLSGAQFLSPAEGLTGGDYDLFELLPAMLRVQVGNGVDQVDTISSLFRREQAGMYRLTTLGVDWNGGRPDFLDGRAVFDIEVGYGANGELDSLYIEANEDASTAGEIFNVGVRPVPLNHVRPLDAEDRWDPQAVSPTVYRPSGGIATSRTYDLSPLLEGANAAYGRIG